MSRVLVVGPRDALEPVIGALYDLRLVHLVDHHPEDPEVPIGKPLPRAAEVSENLVKLRSIASILGVGEGGAPAAERPPGDVRAQILTLEVNLREEDEARKKIEALLQDLGRQADELAPFAALGLPLGMYRGYGSLEVLAGRTTEDVRGLEAAAPEHEILRADRFVAVFVSREQAEKAREALAASGFAPVEVPKADGDPKELLARVQADRGRWTARLAEARERITKLREKYGRFLVGAEDALQVEIEKAEAPLRFAVSDHSFVIDGWVPASRVDGLTGAMAAIPGIYAEAHEAEGLGHEEEAEKPPVLLRNRGPPRRFEFLTNLYSTPGHDEVDPTAFMFLVFPVFFGLMIGDAGYGIVMMILGFTLSAKWKDNKDFADLMRIVLYGGFFAYVFGLVLYGEIFGIPFHARHAGEIDWSGIFGYDIPYAAPIHKLESVGVIDLLLISVLASAVHLGLGHVVGFVNEWKHSKRHAIAKVGWILIVIGFLSFFVVLGRTPEWCGAEPLNEGCRIAEHRVVNQLFFDQPPLAWIPAEGYLVGGMTIPFFMIGSILGGVVLLVVGEPMGALEIIALLSNMMSYTRLAGVAVAKGAVALAFNTMFLPLVINEELLREGIVALNPNLLMVVIGFVFLFLSHAMVLILGAMSAGIQSLRLNYVEFFLKFFKGGGTLFSPFGARKTRTEA